MSLYAAQLSCALAYIQALDEAEKTIEGIDGVTVYIKGPVPLVDEHGDVYAHLSDPDGLGWELSFPGERS